MAPGWPAFLYSLLRIHNSPPEVPFAWDLPDLNIYSERRRNEESPSPAPQAEAAHFVPEIRQIVGELRKMSAEKKFINRLCKNEVDRVTLRL